MASAAIRGDSITLSIHGDLIAEARDVSLSFDVGEIDVTSMDSNRWGEFLVGRVGWTVTGSGLYIISDVARQVMLEQVTAAVPALFTIILTVSTQTFTGTAVVTAFSLSANYDGAVESSFTLKGSGTLTISPC